MHDRGLGTVVSHLIHRRLKPILHTQLLFGAGVPYAKTKQNYGMHIIFHDDCVT